MTKHPTQHTNTHIFTHHRVNHPSHHHPKHSKTESWRSGRALDSNGETEEEASVRRRLTLITRRVRKTAAPTPPSLEMVVGMAWEEQGKRKHHHHRSSSGRKRPSPSSHSPNRFP